MIYIQLKPKKKMKNEKRIKERTIKDVKEKVYQWRNIAIDNNISLEKAAEIIGISRKTLDDYCLQIRKGKECGFDYVKNKNAKMGELRQFVKENSHVKNMGILDIKGQDTTQVNSNFEEVPISNNYSHTTNIQQDDIGQFFSNNCQENQDKFQLRN
ncbi:hypothetical protein PPERSA_09477 [Pseudocohnilembus persalinus]|uniref:Uncharacterized protein n=1 Tax=Pseudocohnilembus persalinus TaxID=266149 RepID=A0A0V0QR80_PSEPJ|nr:hypothetical protein PPERSA_09477 [Pseudocohnilembus persalinus]|eukprot:KRX04685.1 hypothetical protein PPERSA_09477 [Pseudocohnilembus persalinus]